MVFFRNPVKSGCGNPRGRNQLSLNTAEALRQIKAAAYTTQYSLLALRLTIFLPLIFFFLCLAAYEVSSDPRIEGARETEHASLSQAFHVFTRDNRRLMEDMVLRLSRYLNQGHHLEANVMAPAAAPGPVHNPVPLDCGGLCSHRCSLHSRKNVCLRACGTCCARCKCVPPGTSGNREMCGKCYSEMTTHGNKPKCP